MQVKHGELFVADDTHTYPLYRRGDEPAFRLKNPQAPGQDELILHIHQSKEWLLGADAPQPVAGTSSGVLNPWRPPVTPPPDWRPPTVRAATESRIYRSSAPNTECSPGARACPWAKCLAPRRSARFMCIWTPPGFPYDVIYIGAQYDRPTASGVGYYRVLAPGDSAPWSGLAFITKDEPLVSLARADLERWTDTALEEQPIPVSRTQAGEWRLHAPLFDTPLERSVATAFPNLTTHSRSMAVARLVELADTSRSATASHLLNVRAALDNWLTPTANRLGQTDDLLRMLRPHRKQRPIDLYRLRRQGTGLHSRRLQRRRPGPDPAHRRPRACAAAGDCTARSRQARARTARASTCRNCRSCAAKSPAMNCS